MITISRDLVVVLSGGQPKHTISHMTDVNPYDIENVRIRYYGNNDAKAYAAGFETRLFGELVKDAESWISLGIMRTKENIKNDYYTEYTLDSLNQPR